MFIQFNVCLFYLDGSLLDRISLFWSTVVCKIFKNQYDVLKCHTKHTGVCVCLLFTKILLHVAIMQVINLTFKWVILSPALIFSLHWAVLFLQSWLYNSLVSHWTGRSVCLFKKIIIIIGTASSNKFHRELLTLFTLNFIVECFVFLLISTPLGYKPNTFCLCNSANSQTSLKWAILQNVTAVGQVEGSWADMTTCFNPVA